MAEIFIRGDIQWCKEQAGQNHAFSLQISILHELSFLLTYWTIKSANKIYHFSPGRIFNFHTKNRSTGFTKSYIFWDIGLLFKVIYR